MPPNVFGCKFSSCFERKGAEIGVTNLMGSPPVTYVEFPVAELKKIMDVLLDEILVFQTAVKHPGDENLARLIIDSIQHYIVSND